jgi:hypothetical protein
MSENLHRLMETSHAIINTAAGGTIAVVPATPGNRVSIYRMIITSSGAVTVTIQDTSGGALSEPFAFGTNGGAVTVDIQPNGDPWWQSGLGLGIQLLASAPVQVSSDIYYLVTP